jgi:predicted signal transduction protein with EAL and GGDEF domain
MSDPSPEPCPPPPRPLARDGFLAATGDAIRARRGAQPRLALFLARLVDLRAVNEDCGHAQGDRLLAALAQRLLDLPGVVSVGRVGGPVLAALVDLAQGLGGALRLGRAIAQPLTAAAGVASRVRAGCALWPDDADDADALLIRAEIALDEGASLPDAGLIFFLEEMAQRRHQERLVATRLARALPEGHLSLAFQPILDSARGRIGTVEALARWHDPELGPVSPALFIPIAERHGLITALGRHVLREACREVASWQRGPARGVGVSVNVSPEQFVYPEICDSVELALAETGLPPALLTLELTEGLLVRDSDAAGRAMRRLAAQGVRLAIDDFGTGHASFAYLRHYPVTELKMDRSLLPISGSPATDEAIARTILQLAQLLRLEVVAEGVETEEQARWACSAGARHLQGYWLAAPMPAGQCQAFCAARGDMAPFPLPSASFEPAPAADATVEARPPVRLGGMMATPPPR